MSALRRLLSVAALSTGSRDASPQEGAAMAADGRLDALHSPEIETVPIDKVGLSENQAMTTPRKASLRAYLL